MSSPSLTSASSASSTAAASTPSGGSNSPLPPPVRRPASIILSAVGAPSTPIASGFNVAVGPASVGSPVRALTSLFNLNPLSNSDITQRAVKSQWIVDEKKQHVLEETTKQTAEKKKKTEVATLTLPDGKVIQLPILYGSEGPAAIDIRKLFDTTGYITYDPGFTSTGSCQSAITFIDGPAGILKYRGYNIEELSLKSDFDEVSYLILYGELPSKRQKEIHSTNITKHRMIHEQLIQFYKGFKSDAHPMAIMIGVVGALSAFYHDSLDISKPEHRALSAYRLIAKMPTIAAIAYKTSMGQPIVYPRDDLSYIENFLYMMFALPTQPYELNPVMVKAVEVFFLLHLDHEQNASTSTVRIAGSSLANPFACIASGISSLWGPQHGGANEAVINMLEQIGSKDKIPEFIKKVKDKVEGVRLMGFGHRVYKNFDPRAKLMKEVCHELLQSLGIANNNPLFELALELERIALSDDYFISRKLYPNVDFYSGMVMRAMGFDVSMFTVMFAVARTVGWVAQWKEMIEEKEHKIGRPRQLYTGAVTREYKKIEERPEVLPTENLTPVSPGGNGSGNGNKRVSVAHVGRPTR